MKYILEWKIFTSIAFGPEILKMHRPDRPKGVERAKIVDGFNK